MTLPDSRAATAAATPDSQPTLAFSSWEAVAEWLRRSWGEPDSSPELGAVAEMIAAAEPTRSGQIARALTFVRREVRDAGGPLRLDQPPNAPRTVLQAAEGNDVDRAALLWHLLRRLGLPARPVFTGPALEDASPALTAFDRVLVEVGGRCHTVDAPDPARDRGLADGPLGLTLAPGIVELEPINPWQAPPAIASEPASPKPPPIALRPDAPAPSRPVQVDFVLDFASRTTARAAEVESLLFAPPPVEKVENAPATPTTPVALPEPVTAAQQVTEEPTPPAPTPATTEPETVTGTAPSPAFPEAPAEPVTVASPLAPEPAAPIASTPAPPPETGPAPRRRSLREELEARARLHRDAARPAPAPASLPPAERERAAPAPRSRDQRPSGTERPVRRDPVAPPPRANRPEHFGYTFDPTIRGERQTHSGQLKIALMVLGFLAVIALWVFVFLAKRGGP